MQRLVARELMDGPGLDPAELAENFSDIERANRWFGGIRPVASEVFSRAPSALLDVGCGSADIVRALLRESRARRIPLEIVALDRSEAVLRIAAERTGDEPAIRFVCADGMALPFAAGSFDLATCNLALHHFEPEEAVRLLGELRRVSRRTPLVSDLARSRTGWLATAAYARFIAKNRLTKHDAPLSVRRAYTPDEACELARRAGWRGPQVRRYPFFRMVLSDRD